MLQQERAAERRVDRAVLGHMVQPVDRGALRIASEQRPLDPIRRRAVELDKRPRVWMNRLHRGAQQLLDRCSIRDIRGEMDRSRELRAPASGLATDEHSSTGRDRLL